jgi:hypothetical protein
MQDCKVIIPQPDLFPCQVTHAKSSHDYLQLKMLSAGPDWYYETWSKQVGGLSETLEEFLSVQLSVDTLVEMLDIVKPRW